MGGRSDLYSEVLSEIPHPVVNKTSMTDMVTVSMELIVALQSDKGKDVIYTKVLLNWDGPWYGPSIPWMQ